MSSFPRQLVTTDALIHGNCCCASCPDTVAGCLECPNVLIQGPTIEFECQNNPAGCPGPFDPPLLEVGTTGMGASCNYLSEAFNTCDKPFPVPFFYFGGCDTSSFFPDTPPPILRWYMRHEFGVKSIAQGAGLDRDLINSLFIKFDAPPSGVPGTEHNQCLPPGIYEHVVTWVLTTGGGTTCNPIVTGPVGDLMVIEI